MTGCGARDAAARALADRLAGLRPRVLLTLGSGLGALADEVAEPLEIPFAELGLPEPTVPGHSGRLVAGRLQGVPVLVQQGRVHLYEGVSAEDVSACVRAAAGVGVGLFLVTNAAGGLAADLAGPPPAGVEDLEPGALVLLSDHLNLTGASPLPGAVPPRFVDLRDAYDPDLRALARAAARDAGQRLHDGVYAGVAGPAYETPAEARMLRLLGADVVGMSTVVEVVAARACGLRVCGFSVVTNVHRRRAEPTDHDRVLAAGRAAGPRLTAVLRALLPRLAPDDR